jgi:hypothetical protein
MNLRHLLSAGWCSLLAACGDAPLLQDASGRYRIVARIDAADVGPGLGDAARKHGEPLLVIAHDDSRARRAAAMPDRRFRIVAVGRAPHAGSALRPDLDVLVVEETGAAAAIDIALLWCHGITPPRQLTVGTRIVVPGDSGGGTPSPAPGDFVLELLRHQHRDLLTAPPKTDVVFRIGLATLHANLVLEHRDAGGDPARLDAAARDLMALGCRAVLVSTDDPASLSAIAESARAGNAALIVFDPLARCAGAGCSVGCDQQTLGRAAAQAARRLLPEGAAIVELGDPLDGALQVRRQGFAEALGLREHP